MKFKKVYVLYSLSIYVVYKMYIQCILYVNIKYIFGVKITRNIQFYAKNYNVYLSTIAF